MNKRIFCFYQDKRGEWKRATQEMFDRAEVVWKLYPYKQFHTEVINKDATKLWKLFEECLSQTKKDYYNDPSGVYINGQQTPIAFGSNLSCEKLNKRYEVEWKPYKGIDNLYTPDKDFYSEKSYKYEVKLKNGSKIFVTYEDIWEDYYTGFQDQFDTRHDRLFKDKDDNIIDDKDFMQYRLVENNNLPKCPYKDYAESCCNNCSFKNKPGCREKEWNKIQEQWQEDAYNEERMRQEAYEDAMRDELMRSNYDADYGDVKY